MNGYPASVIHGKRVYDAEVYDRGMTEWAYAAFVAFLGVQPSLAVLVYADARRLELKDPFVWVLGVVVPAAGIPVILYYLFNRNTLPKTAESEPRTE
jgi:hypothetical protein